MNSDYWEGKRRDEGEFLSTKHFFPWIPLPSHSWVQPSIEARTYIKTKKHLEVAFVQQSVATWLWPIWDMYCIMKHIYYCTFFFCLSGHLKGTITPLNSHFLFLSLDAAKIRIYEQLFPKAKDCNLSSRVKGRLALKPEETFSFLELLYCDGVMDSVLGKCPLDPRENKTLWTVSSFFPAR